MTYGTIHYDRVGFGGVGRVGSGWGGVGCARVVG